MYRPVPTTRGSPRGLSHTRAKRVRLRRTQAHSGEAAQAIANCWDYLNEHRGRTHYRQLCRGGYPLGSGGIESSNKCICHVRLKRSGAWWYEATSNHMLLIFECLNAPLIGRAGHA
jgi:hypothetical protein